MPQFKFIIAIVLLLLCASPLSFAQSETKTLAQNSRQNATSSAYIDIIPAPEVKENTYPTSFSQPTHPPITLSPDKSEIIKLDKPIATIIAGNPAHLAIIPGTEQSIILVGRLPGATHFIALNDKSEIIMQRHVLVAAPKQDYVRIRKTCAATENPEECASTDMYYCPEGMCHNIAIPMPQEASSSDGAEDDAEGASGESQDNMPDNASPE